MTQQRIHQPDALQLMQKSGQGRPGQIAAGDHPPLRFANTGIRRHGCARVESASSRARALSMGPAPA